jgi:4-hydroxy-3-methylbut-2-enyl diphosphate reductase
MMSAEILKQREPFILPEIPASFNVQEVRVAGNRGACGGVEMTLAVVSQVLEVVPPDIEVWTTNSPVNFPPAFDKYGARLKSAKGDISQVPDGAVLIISAHGAPPAMFDEARARNMYVVDTTCPFVLNEQEKVRQAAADGIPTIFLGEENHPETIGVREQVAPESITVFDPSHRIGDVSIPDGTRVFAKTTNDPEQTEAAIEELQQINPTIDTSKAHSCYALQNRFASGKQLIKAVDYWLVVGDQSSHNAKGIRSIANGRDIPSALVRVPEDINWSDFGPEIRIVGVSAAASVPEEYTQRVLEPFRQLGVNVIELAQTIPEAYRMFKLPNAQLETLRQRFN